MKIRRATIEDQEEICVLIRQLEDYVKLERKPSERDLRETLAKLINSPNCLVLVAEDGDKIIGLLTMWVRSTLFHGAESALIDELIVDKSYRGRGIGKELVKGAFAEAKLRGCIEIEVSTEKNNQKAIEFYKKCGFTEEHILLEKELQKLSRRKRKRENPSTVIRIK